MATVFEIVKKLRRGEKVIIHNQYKVTLMQQMSDHEIGDIRVNFSPHDKNHTSLELSRR